MRAFLCPACGGIGQHRAGCPSQADRGSFTVVTSVEEEAVEALLGLPVTILRGFAEAGSTAAKAALVRRGVRTMRKDVA